MRDIGERGEMPGTAMPLIMSLHSVERWQGPEFGGEEVMEAVHLHT